MNKPDFPPLLSPGIHSLSLVEFEKIAVAPFPNDPQRLRLFLLFSQWVLQLQALHVSAILWIDGSFVTEKNDPDDIDCVMWSPTSTLNLSAKDQIEIEKIVDRATLKAQFGLDFYLEFPPDDQKFHREAYWKGVFGFQHDGKSAKGFVELSI